MKKLSASLHGGLNSTVEEGLAKSPMGTDSTEHKCVGESNAESELVMSPRVLGTLRSLCRPPFHSLCSVFVTSFSTSFCQHQEAEDHLAGWMRVQPPVEDTQGQGLALNDFHLHSSLCFFFQVIPVFHAAIFHMHNTLQVQLLKISLPI